MLLNMNLRHVKMQEMLWPGSFDGGSKRVKPWLYLTKPPNFNQTKGFLLGCCFDLHLKLNNSPANKFMVYVLFQEPSSFSILFQTKEQVRFYSFVQSCGVRLNPQVRLFMNASAVAIISGVAVIKCFSFLSH